MAAKKKVSPTSAAFTGTGKKSIRNREKVLRGDKTGTVKKGPRGTAGSNMLGKGQSATKIKKREAGERAAKNRVAKIAGRQAKADALMARRKLRAVATGRTKGMAKAAVRYSKNKDIRARKMAKAARLSKTAASGAG